MKKFAQFFKALSDETRLQIIALLMMEPELCVCDIENVLELTQSKASRHLRYLLNSGILTDERKNVWVYYRINEGLESPEIEILKAFYNSLDKKLIEKLSQKLNEWKTVKKNIGTCDV
jgi:ArsR family transcriptional regulator, arsenate/arsenite/antimonite-responsive transcriptional repressor